MRRNLDPGTRKPLSCPLSKQRMMVCWLTLQILAASPVVKTVFMGTSIPTGTQPAFETGPHILSSTRRRRTEIFRDKPVLVRSLAGVLERRGEPPASRGGAKQPGKFGLPGQDTENALNESIPKFGLPVHILSACQLCR